MALPYVAPPDLHLGVPVHIFGVIVAVGVTVGAAVMRRYAKRAGESDANARTMVAWVTATGIIGAHVLDVLFYRPGEVTTRPWVLLEFWTSISSYGGFVGGALGWGYIVWRRKLRLGRWADITVVGLLVAFSIGRGGCTTVHDHLGAETTSFIGVDVPREDLAESYLPRSNHADTIRVHDLGMEELLYLIPVNALVLFLAFRRKLRPGVLAVLTVVLYAPVRFGLEEWRLASTDPPYGGLTFAQWCSLAVFALAVFAGIRIALSTRVNS